MVRCVRFPSFFFAFTHDMISVFAVFVLVCESRWRSDKSSVRRHFCTTQKTWDCIHGKPFTPHDLIVCLFFKRLEVCVPRYTGTHLQFYQNRTIRCHDKAPGNIVDWMYFKARVKYAYAASLRDTSTVSNVSKPILSLLKVLDIYCYSKVRFCASAGMDLWDLLGRWSRHRIRGTGDSWKVNA